MNKNLLILDPRYTQDTNVLKKAVSSIGGWETIRGHYNQVSSLDLSKYDKIKYYGNTLTASMLLPFLPKLIPIPYKFFPMLHEFTGRKIRHLQLSNLQQPIKKKKFIKPVGYKYFEARIYEQGEFIEQASNPSDYIYVSDIKKFSSEIRCFCLNGKIETISWYKVYDERLKKTLFLDEISIEQLLEDHGDPHELLDTTLSSIPYAVEEIYKLCSYYDNPLPNGVVMDFGYDPASNKLLLIEFNEAFASGLYYCDPLKAFNAIINSQE